MQPISYIRRGSQGFLVSLLLITVALLALSGCANTPSPTPPTSTPEVAAPISIGLSLSNLANPFFASMRDGANEAAARLNVTVVVQDAADNADTQAQQIQDLITQGVRVLLINPVDSDAIAASVEAANAANIPVITIDRSANGGTVLAHIASDNVAGGRMAGNYLAETLGNQGNIVELTGIEGTSAARDRGAGFNEAVAAFSDMHVTVRETANFSREEGQTVFASILEANAEIDAVFAHNDEMILGAIEAARAAGRLSEIRFIGFDAVEDALTALESGDLLATIAQQPAEMGRLGIENAVRVVNGESVAASIPVDLALITR